MINSKKKGSRGERSFRDKLREHGFKASRGQQYHGGPESPDVLCPSLPFYWEVKSTERLHLSEAYAQAITDACGKTPIIAHRRKRGVWMTTLSADDFLEIVRRSEYVITHGGEPEKTSVVVAPSEAK
jgi:Holliday junction resolvase